MSLSDAIGVTSVFGLLAGPVAAVLISMWIEERRQRRFRQLTAARGLLIGRINLADPAFQLAINTIPIDFAENDEVLTAWEGYIEAVAKQPVDDPQVREGWLTAQRTLAKSVLIAIGYKERAAAQIVRNPYTAGAYVDNVLSQQNALKAVVDLARNTDRIATANETIVATAAQAGQQAAAKPPPQNSSTNALKPSS